MAIQGIKKEGYTQGEETVFSHGMSVTLDGSNFTISKFTQQEDSPSIDWDGEAESSFTLSVDDIKTDSVSGANIADHTVVTVVNGKAVDFFRSSKASRANAISAVVGNDNVNNYVAFVIPFADSSTDDWTVLCNGDLNLNGSNVTSTYSGNVVDKALELLPSISAVEASGTVTATISPAKEGVEVFFETTKGSLSASRASTDASGVATVSVSDASGGKVKVGFKHFVSKVEVNVA